MKSRLKLWLGGSALVLVLLVLVAPVAVGTMSEHRYKALWANALDSEPGYQAEVVEYDRGWFNARSRVRIEVSDPMASEWLLEFGMAEAGPGDTALVYLEERIHHGPFPISSAAPLDQRLKPGFAVVDTRPASELPFFRDNDIFVISSTRLGLFGGVDGFLRAMPFDVHVGDGLRLVNEGVIRVEIQSNLKFERIRSRMGSDELRLEDSQFGGVILEGFDGRSDQRRGPAQLWLGEVEFGLDSVRTLGSDPAFELRDFAWSALTDNREDFLVQNHTVDIGAIAGPALEVGPISVDYDLFNLHPQALADLQLAFAEAPALDEDSVEAAGDSFSDHWLDALLEVALHRPGSTLNSMDTRLFDDSISGAGEIQLRPLSREQLETYLNEDRFGRLANGHGRLSTSRALLQRLFANSMMGVAADEELDENTKTMVDQQIDGFINQGMLRETDAGLLELHVELEDGVLRLNGDEMMHF
ncbi:DUF945 family protein [Gammaproteobacteria bacterium AB-CW1]|uniref:DUF945 family protein n=1 Tax=Natronospira elongata TaxID=3110268 RepID=A0AAP6MLT6_9GAMM|nr:DUF945 family protein [Gammaproteobacteria bacterium AB-CW1]